MAGTISVPGPIGPPGGITHFDDAPAYDVALGHLRGHWTALGDAAGSVNVGVNRIQLPAGGWSTPVHEHGRQEEIFYVLGGRGLSWQAGRTSEVGSGDCIVYAPRGGEHTLYALEDLDVLAFGPREYDEAVRLPRLAMSLLSGRAVESAPGTIDGAPFQFVRESQLGPPGLPAEPGPRPSTIVNLAAVSPERMERTRVVRTRRDLGRAAGSVRTGLKHIEVAPGKEASPQHCHSAEEEIFVILEGDGVLVLGDVPTPVRRGHVVARPAASNVAHVFRAGQSGLSLLAYGSREPGDMCYYPRSNKIAFRGVGVVARLERLDYWDGED